MGLCLEGDQYSGFSFQQGLPMEGHSDSAWLMTRVYSYHVMTDYLGNAWHMKGVAQHWLY